MPTAVGATRCLATTAGQASPRSRGGAADRGSTFPAAAGAAVLPQAEARDPILSPGWPQRLLFLLACAVAAHVLLSPLGFNLTDDGFVLAQSRRILAGQVPHRDFISIRPVGSAFLHVADLVLGGGHPFLVSRLIYWIEVALACWAWLEITIARNRLRPGALGALPLAALAFMLSTHAFPPMAWYTVDAVLLTSLGFLLSGARRPAIAWLGYGLMGAAAVCKQNFVPLAPLAVVLNGDARRPGAWVAALAAPALYLSSLLLLGAGQDLRAQLTAVTSVTVSGIGPYRSPLWFPAGLALGVVLASSVRGPLPGGRALWGGVPWIALAVAWAVLALAARHLDADGFRFIRFDAFRLLGMAAGFAAVACVRPRDGGSWGAAVFLVALAWCSGISTGYLTPAHVCGPLATTLVLGLIARFDEGHRDRAIRVAWLGGLVVLALSTPHWWSARRNHIYHETTAPLLTRDLAGVLPGGAGIRTDDSTYAMLADLRGHVDRLNGRPYAILVDGPGWWVGAPQLNPLPADWPQSMELCTDNLQRRLTGSIVQQRGRIAVLVQKATAVYSSEGFVPVGVDPSFYEAAVWAKHTLDCESETRYWAVYR